MSATATDRTPRRRVDSGTWPLYVMQLAALLISAVVQLWQWKVPASIASQSPGWYDVLYLWLQPVGATLVLVALFAVRPLVPSLHLERVGALINATVGLVYVTAVMLANGGPPASGATWLVAGFSVYSVLRVHEINKAFGLDTLAFFRRKGNR